MKVLAGCVAPEASQPDSKVDSFPLAYTLLRSLPLIIEMPALWELDPSMTSFHLVTSLKVLTPNAVTSRAEAPTHVFRGK